MIKSFFISISDGMQVTNIGKTPAILPGAILRRRNQVIPSGPFFMEEANGSWHLAKSKGGVWLSYFNAEGTEKWRRFVSEPGEFMVNAKGATKKTKRNASGFADLIEKYADRIQVKTAGDMSEVRLWAKHAIVTDGDIVYAGIQAALSGATYVVSFVDVPEIGTIARIFVRENDDLAIAQAKAAVEKRFSEELSGQTASA